MPVLAKAHIWLDNRGEAWIDEANTTPSPTSNIERPGRGCKGICSPLRLEKRAFFVVAGSANSWENGSVSMMSKQGSGVDQRTPAAAFEGSPNLQMVWKGQRSFDVALPGSKTRFASKRNVGDVALRDFEALIITSRH